ncbi:hypothetical protein [Umezawaea sp.]|uniref:hypothetical protein n=1 Tax=Umezawaea sp. TaxID=1955258 RepID=UPI002ED36769
MFKKIGAVVVTAAAGMGVMGGVASASTDFCGDYCLAEDPADRAENIGPEYHYRAGLVFVNGEDVVRSTSFSNAFCGNDVDAAGVRSPAGDAVDGVDFPVMAPGQHQPVNASPDFCSVSGTIDQGIDSNGR